MIKKYEGIVNNKHVKGEKVIFTADTTTKKYRFDSVESTKGTHGWIPLVGNPAGPVRAWNRWTGQNLDPEEVWS